MPRERGKSNPKEGCTSGGIQDPEGETFRGSWPAVLLGSKCFHEIGLGLPGANHRKFLLDSVQKINVQLSKKTTNGSLALGWVVV